MRPPSPSALRPTLVALVASTATGLTLLATPTGAADAGTGADASHAPSHAPSHAMASPSAAAQAGQRHCARQRRVDVPAAEEQKTACLDDLTTAGTTVTGHTRPDDWSALHAPGTTNPTGVPGIQVDGYFPDDSTTNTNNGWQHDSQFVVRLPDDWNGKLVVTGAPGVRTQYAGDFVFSDWLLARGYAYASTDKGNTGTSFYSDGEKPGDAIAEWNRRVTQLTRQTKRVVRQRYRRAPRRTYAAGVSNGGYLVRWQLENRPRLYDGGVDWEGALYRPTSPTLFDYLPVTLRNYPAYAAGDEAAHRRMLAAGIPKGSEYSWDYHYSVYWDLTQRVYREEVDPGWDGELEAGIPFCQSGTPRCDADYDYAARPVAHRALHRVRLTGDLRRPMLTVHGTHDALLPIGTDSDIYRRMVRRHDSAARHRYYRVVGGTHVDGMRGEFGERVRPLLPCVRGAFTQMTRWVERGQRPPRSRTIRRLADRGAELDHCPLG